MPAMVFRAGFPMTDQPTEIPELPTERSIDRLVSLLEPISRVIQPRLYTGSSASLQMVRCWLETTRDLWPPRRAIHDGRDLEAPQTLPSAALASTLTTQFRSGETC